MGSSIAQGGSGYPFLAPCVFSYIAGEDLGDIKVAREEIPAFDVTSALERVCTIIVIAIDWCMQVHLLVLY